MKKLIFILLLSPFTSFSQEYYTPSFITELSDSISENSGLIFFNNQVWTHNDSGGEAKIYSIDTLTGAINQSILILDAVNIDWEDIAQDEMHIYIGDFGNNFGDREDLCIYKVSKQDIIENLNDSVHSEKIYFSYEDQSTEYSYYNHNRDCEALVSAGDSLYLFSKNWQNQKSYLYALGKVMGTYSLNAIDSFDSQGMICGADYQNNTLILLGYTNQVLSQSFAWIFSEINNNHFFEAEGLKINFDIPYYSQTEGVCFIKPKHIYFSSEASFELEANLYSVNLDDVLDINEYEMSISRINAKIISTVNILGQEVDPKTYGGITITIYNDFKADKNIKF